MTTSSHFKTFRLSIPSISESSDCASYMPLNRLTYGFDYGKQIGTAASADPSKIPRNEVRS